MTAGGSVVGDAPLRLFVALTLAPDDSRWLADWADREVTAGRHLDPDDLHVTLAFLGTVPGRALGVVDEALRAAAAAGPVGALAVRGWRATGRVGMLVLRDEGGGATRLQAALRARLRDGGLLPAGPARWLPHVTVVRGDVRGHVPTAVPIGRTLVPSDAAAYLSRLHREHARYEALVRVPLESMTRGG